MNTPAHLIIGLAAFSKPAQRRVTWAAGIGAIAPDLSLYLMAGASLTVVQIPPEVVFGQLYFSAGWQQVFAIDNSFLLWGLLLAFMLWRAAPAGIAFAGAALLHLALDFPLHHDDGRPHFWPATDWIFASPLSYWDGDHHAAWVAPAEGILALVCAGVLIRRHRGYVIPMLCGALLVMEYMVIRSWLLFF
jgi:membrane-bound metal-dependent hydrolase YbcI (DUF457 family)